ncbi:MAG: hypothetical protein QNK37_18620 [Acidobacteriota bacterium]|nr:hypothetical protein [Acidobacteriota bacterium]
MRTALFCCLLLLPAGVLAQGRNAYKKPFEAGLKQFEDGNYEAALTSFQQALSFKEKASIYRGEGTFSGQYLPRYRIALCYEALDQLIEAEEWANLSKTVLEGDVIKNKRKDLGVYNTDISRILKKAADYRQVRNERYNRALNDAKALVTANKYDQAKKAFEALAESDPSRTEAATELRALPAIRANYLKGRELEVQTAIVQGDFGRAEGLLNSIAEIDSGYANLPVLRSTLEDARKKAEEARIAAATPKSPPDPEPKPAERDTKEETTKVVENTKPPERKTQPRADAAAAKARRDKQALRTALLATVEPYRRGDPANALARLEEIDLKAAEKSASYHWLKGVYLLSAYMQAPDPVENLMTRAREAMKTLSGLMPNFEPNDALYPDFVIDFYRETKAAQ